MRELIERAWANYDPDFNPLTQKQWKDLAVYIDAITDPPPQKEKPVDRPLWPHQCE